MKKDIAVVVANNVAWGLYLNSPIMGESEELTPNEPMELAEYWLGLIPSFFNHEMMDMDHDQIVDAVEAAYGFPASRLEGGVINDLVYRYKDDPELYPLAATKLAGKTAVAIYAYGITAFITGDKQTIVRMD